MTNLSQLKRGIRVCHSLGIVSWDTDPSLAWMVHSIDPLISTQMGTSHASAQRVIIASYLGIPHMPLIWLLFLGLTWTSLEQRASADTTSSHNGTAAPAFGILPPDWDNVLESLSTTLLKPAPETDPLVYFIEPIGPALGLRDAAATLGTKKLPVVLADELLVSDWRQRPGIWFAYGHMEFSPGDPSTIRKPGRCSLSRTLQPDRRSIGLADRSVRWHDDGAIHKRNRSGLGIWRHDGIGPPR